MRSGFVQAVVLALSTILLPAGADAEEASSLEYSLNPLLVPSWLDPRSENNDDSIYLGAVMDACKRQRQRFLSEWRTALKGWSAGHDLNPQQCAFNYFSLLVLLDFAPSPNSHLAKAEIIGELCRKVPGEEIVEAMTRLVLEPNECRVLRSAPELGLMQTREVDDVRAACSNMVRETLYHLRLDKLVG